jgi:hypothetical protein
MPRIDDLSGHTDLKRTKNPKLHKRSQAALPKS